MMLITVIIAIVYDQNVTVTVPQPLPRRSCPHQLDRLVAYSAVHVRAVSPLLVSESSVCITLVLWYVPSMV